MNHLILSALVLPLFMIGTTVIYSQSHCMESKQFPDESPITVDQIEAALEPRRILEQTPYLACDLKNNPEDQSEIYFWDLYQAPYITKEGVDENLIYVDRLHLCPDQGKGSIKLFRGNNLASIIIAKDIYTDYANVSSQESAYLTSILYCVFKFSKGIFFKNMDEIFCYVCWIETRETEQRRGYARFALTQFIETTFRMSSVSFINALIGGFNFPSQSLFKSLGFLEYDKMLSLDGGVTLILPSRNFAEGNYYLSRFDWEKRGKNSQKI